MGRFIAQLQGQDGRWADVFYTDDPDRAARFVAGMVEGNPYVKTGRVVDATQEQETEEAKR